MEYNRIFVAVDGSKEAEFALKKAVAISGRNNNAKIYVVHVIDKSTRAYIAEAVDQLYLMKLKLYAEGLMKQYEMELTEQNVPFELICLEGNPKQELYKKFKTLQEDDLVICGAIGIHSSVERILFGSVSESIVRNSNSDVLVVRTPE
jgi:nucleotide-binding universal stress UspA family protein